MEGEGEVEGRRRSWTRQYGHVGPFFLLNIGHDIQFLSVYLCMLRIDVGAGHRTPRKFIHRGKTKQNDRSFDDVRRGTVPFHPLNMPRVSSATFIPREPWRSVILNLETDLRQIQKSPFNRWSTTSGSRVPDCEAAVDCIPLPRVHALSTTLTVSCSFRKPKTLVYQSTAASQSGTASPMWLTTRLKGDF